MNSCWILDVDAIKYKTDKKRDIDLRAFANQLGILKSSPRDLVEIHSVVLKKKLADSSSSLPQFYLEEGRLMVFETLGYLTSFYRNYYLSPRETAIDVKSAHKANEPGIQ